jgi:hypothetical protein
VAPYSIVFGRVALSRAAQEALLTAGATGYIWLSPSEPLGRHSRITRFLGGTK